MAQKKKDSGTTPLKRSLRDVAEEQLAFIPKGSADMKGQTTEQLVHELRVHQIELEIQAEELRKAHLALGESRDKYLDLYEFAPLGYFTLSDKAVIAEVNLNGATLLGVERSKLLKSRFSNCIAETDSDEWYRYFLNVLKQEGKQVCTLMLKRGDGSPFPARLESIRITGGRDGAPTVRVAISDITDIRLAEEKLIASEHKFQMLANFTGDWVYWVDPDFRMIYTSPSCEWITGYAPEDFASNPDLSLTIVHPDDRELYKKHRAEVHDSRRPGELEFRIIHRGGSFRWLGHVCRPVIDSAGNFKGTRVSNRDITRRKLAEVALRESEKRLSRFYESGLFGAIYWTMDGKITDANDTFLMMVGYTRDDLVSGRIDWQSMTPPEFRYLDDRSVEELKATGINKNPFEKEYLRKDGSRLPILIAGAMIDEERFKGIAILLDISKQKQSEEMIKTSETQYRTLFERMDEGFCVIEMLYDSDGKATDYRFVEINPAFEKQTGLQQAQGKTIREMVPDHDSHWFEIYGNVAETGESIRFENPAVAMQRYYDVFAFRVGGEKSRKVGVLFNDITGRKAAEEIRERLIGKLEQKNAELERFTYTISHELKSPLITIKWFAGLLEDDVLKCDPVQMKKDAHRITDAADTMQALLSDLLELARIGRIVNPPEKIGFSMIVHEAVDLLTGLINERGVTVEIAPGLPVVNIDHTHIREMMVNLIENAITFLGDRPDPVIRIGVDDSGETPVFFVQDNGIGIDPRYLERIFNLFERLDAHAPGTGIGLTIVRRIIEVHGGKIWAESEGRGKGTTFRFTLPVAGDTPVDLNNNR